MGGNMPGLTILRMVFIFSMIFGMCNCKRGMVNEVYIGQRYSCNNGKKILDSVKSEMQCIHLCLRHEACGYMNYIEENEHKTTKRTCEIFIALEERAGCILLDHAAKSKAMVLKRCENVEKNPQELLHKSPTDAPSMPSTKTVMASSIFPETTSSHNITSATIRTNPLTDSIEESLPKATEFHTSMEMQASSEMVTNPTPTEASERIAVTPSSTLQDMPVSEVLSAYRSCKKIYEADSDNLKSKAYHLQSGEHFCAMERLGECDTGGWTLAISINGSRQTFDVDSSYWVNEEVYNIEAGLVKPFLEEAKYPAFNSLSFDKICIGMNYINTKKWIMLEYQGSSLRSIFQSGTYQETCKGKSAWKNAITGSSLHDACVKEGFNVKDGSGNNIARVGVIGDNADSCSNPSSYIGLGTKVNIQYSCSGNITGVSCGNFVACDGNISLPTSGYIFIQ